MDQIDGITIAIVVVYFGFVVVAVVVNVFGKLEICIYNFIIHYIKLIAINSHLTIGLKMIDGILKSDGGPLRPHQSRNAKVLIYDSHSKWKKKKKKKHPK